MNVLNDEWMQCYLTRHKERCGNCGQIKQMGRCSGIFFFKEDHIKGCGDWISKKNDPGIYQGAGI